MWVRGCEWDVRLLKQMTMEVRLCKSKGWKKWEMGIFYLLSDLHEITRDKGSGEKEREVACVWTIIGWLVSRFKT